MHSEDLRGRCGYGEKGEEEVAGPAVACSASSIEDLMRALTAITMKDIQL